ncbi:MAG: hypothetical protein COS85_20300 [Armatimonadetes bacterium CG07_land_8_20_14_0_80_59_28]|nr:MAG: hypothetical protein COS85_20300 [Armatimonadetes bacterium CG07_land_8_20_14_0_80_59_28]PIY48974.1 MAG: hypothetical protein COZ05_01700 [Armatimonadetes bacterium CG_4_10_14_3_um_filter_59_10]
MSAPTYLCPSCGAENQKERTVCFKCYAPLHPEEIHRPSKKTTRSQAAAVATRQVVSVTPGALIKGFVGSLREESLYRYVVLLFALIALVWSIAVAANFNVLPSAYAHLAALGLLSIGMTAAIRVGGVDLSLGPIAAAAGCVALLSQPFGATFALATALLLGFAIGVINGVLASRKDRTSPALITLCTGSAIASLLLAYNLGDFSVEGFTRLQLLATGGILGLPFSMLLLIITAVVGNYLLTEVLIKPSDEDEKLASFKEMEVVSAYAFGGFVAALAGVLLMASFWTPKDVVFSAWYLMPLAAVLVGGAILRERKASIPAAICGTLILGAVTSYLHTMGMSLVSLFVAAVTIVLVSSLDSWKGISAPRAYALAKANPLKASQGAAGFCLLFGIIGGLSNDLISRVPSHSAVIIQSSGKVMVRNVGSDLWNQARGRVVLKEGDDIYTDPNSAALLKLSDESVVKLASNTHLRLDQIDQSRTGHPMSRLLLRAGRVYAKVEAALGAFNKFEVETPTAVAAVRGTMWSVSSTETKDYVSVHEGVVDVASAGSQVSVGAGSETSVPRNAPPVQPREMSEAERSAWLREVPVLESPLANSLWESNLSGDFLQDNFDDGRIDPGLWFLRAGAEAKDVFVRESGGRLSIGGMPPRKSGGSSYGAVTPSFGDANCEGSAQARVRYGDGSAVLRLTDSAGRGAVAIVMNPAIGYDLISSNPGQANARHVGPFGNERQTFRRLSLVYDAGTRIVRATVDDMSLGYAEVRFGDDLHFELVYEGENLKEGIDCGFDNFLTNVPLPKDQLLQMVVAALNPNATSGSGMLVMAAPLSEDAPALRSVRVQYPMKTFAASTRPLMQGKGDNMLRNRREDNAWFLYDAQALPGVGDFIFRFRGADNRQWTSWQRLSITEFPQIVNFRDAAQGGSVVVAWDPLPGADFYWVQLLDADSKRVLFNSALLTESHAFIPPTELQGGKGYYSLVAAHIPTGTKSATSHREWQQSVSLVNQWLAPKGSVFVHVNTPAGKDQFAIQCGELRKG